MKKYTTIEALIADAATLTAGTHLTITDYIDGGGLTTNLDVTVLGRDGYRNLQRRTLELLEAVEEPPTLQEDLPASTVKEALHGLIVSLTLALDETQEKASDDRVSYIPVVEGACAHTLFDRPGLYLLRLVSNVPILPTRPLPKGDLPKAKELLRRALDLPIARYIHAVKLENGKFGVATKN